MAVAPGVGAPSSGYAPNAPWHRGLVANGPPTFCSAQNSLVVLGVAVCACCSTMRLGAGGTGVDAAGAPQHHFSGALRPVLVCFFFPVYLSDLPSLSLASSAGTSWIGPGRLQMKEVFLLPPELMTAGVSAYRCAHKRMDGAQLRARPDIAVGG